MKKLSPVAWSANTKLFQLASTLMLPTSGWNYAISVCCSCAATSHL